MLSSKKIKWQIKNQDLRIHFSKSKVQSKQKLKSIIETT